MATKKEKVISCKGDEAEELVLSYLRSQNRPYGATDISANLKSKVSKIQAQKTLASLHEKGEILGKVYGKTTVYCALQTESEELDGVDISAIEGEVTNLKTQEVQLKDEVRQITQQRAEINRDPPTNELESTLASLKSQCQTLESTLAPLRASNPTSPSSTSESAAPLISSISAAELKEVNDSFLNTKTIAFQRRKLGLEIESTLMEVFEKKKGNEGEVWELVGGGRDGLAIRDEEEVWNEVKEIEEGEKEKGRGKK